MKNGFSRRRFIVKGTVGLGAVLLMGLGGFMGADGKSVVAEAADSDGTKGKNMRITVNGKTIVFELNHSQAAKDLYAQLPLSIDVENYGDNEKIFYPPKKLGTADTPLVKAARLGTLAYYAPWGDVVIFYGNFGSAAGLYELGHAIEGEEHIPTLTGAVRIEAV